MAHFPGVFVAVVTPFNESQEVDYGKLREHVDWLISEGVQGLAPAGSVGEYASLTDQERAQMVKTVVDVAAGRVPTVVGSAAPSTAKALQWGNQAREVGAAGLMLLPPINYRPSRAEVIAYYETLSTVGLPIIAYNNPVDTSTDLTPDLLSELAGRTSVVAVKEFSGDVRRIPAILDQTNLDVMVGVDDLVLEGVLAGATGWIAGLTNALPRESVELWKLATSGKLEEAWDLYRRFLPLLRFDTEPYLVQAIKYACRLVGHPVGETRPPRLALTDANRSRVEAALARVHPVGVS